MIRTAAAIFAVLGLVACEAPPPPAAPAPPQAPKAAEPPPAPTPTATATPAKAEMPEGFIGNWDSMSPPCSAWNDSRMTISRDAMTFYESEGPITDLKVISSTEISGTLRLSGEGETFEDTFHYRLDKGGEALVDVNADASVTRRKCP